MTSIQKEISRFDIGLELERFQDNTICEVILGNFSDAMYIAQKGLELAKQYDSIGDINEFEIIIEKIKEEMPINDASQINSDKYQYNENMGELELELENSIQQFDVEPKILKKRREKSELIEVKGIGKAKALLFEEDGIFSIEDLASSTIDRLSGIRGIGKKSAQKYIIAAKDKTNQQRLQKDYSLSDLGHDMSISEPMIMEEISIKEPIITSSIDDIEVERVEEEINFDENYDFIDSPEIDTEESEKIIKIDDVLSDLSKFQRVVPSKINRESIIELEKEKQVSFQTQKSRSPKKNLIEIKDVMETQKSIVEDLPIVREKTINSNQGRIQKLPSGLQGEILTSNEYKNMIRQVGKILNKLKYKVLNKNTVAHSHLFQNVDIIAVKTHQISEMVEIFIWIPIKISGASGKLRVYEDQVKYISNHKNNSIDSTEHRILVGNNIKNIIKSQQNILRDIVSEGSLFKFISNYLQKPISLYKTATKKTLFMCDDSGMQYEVVSCPVLLTSNSVAFMEKDISFAYQKGSNLHVVNSENIEELIKFIEQKHELLEEHQYSRNKNSDDISQYIEEHQRTSMRLVKYFPIPCISFGTLIIVMGFLTPELLSIIIGMGIAAIIIMGLLLVYFSIPLVKKQLELDKNFLTPYHKRKVSFSEIDLILLEEVLNDKWFSQFVYECIDHHENSKILKNKEYKLNKMKLEQRNIEYNVKDDIVNEKAIEKDSILKKYQKFFEDD